MESDQKTLLLVDDEPANLRVLKQILDKDYQLVFAKNGEEALVLLGKQRPDLILLDVMMPGMTGFELCKLIKQDSKTSPIPVIFVTALNDDLDEALGFEVGAVDYITKPVSPAITKARVKNQLSLVHLDELKHSRLQVVQKLGRAAEYRDNETGYHVMRMSLYAKEIALALGYSEHFADNLLHAAPMHDIGKIGIPDNILLKPGKLTAEEFAVMETHPEIGAEIIGDDDSELLRMAHSVALTHHEKWDGSGYPRGLQGEAIPIEGRIVALADVFDALTSKRPYKEAWKVEDTLSLIESQSGKHFDPRVVKAFKDCLETILAVKEKFRE